jgi:3'(2'), 5'-bisphosphate nucleotidase
LIESKVQNTYRQLTLYAVQAALAAGRRIMEVYDKPIEVDYKEDRSPLTAADRAAHKEIVNHLRRQTPDIPILSEEGKGIDFEVRRHWNRFWLVDPLDGTKEFIKRNGEFTVNIALIENDKPVLGVIYVPCPDQLYLGCQDMGSIKIENCKELDSNCSFETLLSVGHQLPMNTPSSPPHTIRVIGSRSHGSKEFQEYIQSLESEYESVEITSTGSSLKFCLVAEGKADIYPRLGPTMEWDVAAGHIIAELAGCSVVIFGSGNPLEYNKKNLTNPSFCCFINLNNPIIQ